MKKTIVIPLAIVFVGLAAIVFFYLIQPRRMTPETMRQAIVAEERLNQVPIGQEATEEEVSNVPDVFYVKFECSNGDFVAEFHKEWAPRGVARVHALVTGGVLNEARFFRVLPGFVVQWGIPGNPRDANFWREQAIKDDPVIEPNRRGVISFAARGPDTRTTQMFVNLADNPRLDDMGFAGVGKVIQGMEVVDAITSKYGEQPDQVKIFQQGNAYLQAEFPDLDYIKRTILLETPPPAEAPEAASAE